MKSLSLILATLLLGLEFAFETATARAELILYEGFDYGDADGTIHGRTGGFGFGGAWTVVQSDFAYWYGDGQSNSYQGAGLSFGSNFATSGGNAVVYGGGFDVPGQRTTDYRPIGVNQTGTIYGSFLFNIAADQTSGNNMHGLNALLIGPTAAEGASVYELATNEFATNHSAVRGPGTPGYPSFLSGAAPDLNTTYLYLFKLTNVGGEGGAVDAWVLTQDQYDHFKTAGSTPGEVLESDLNAALLGSGDVDVWERGSFSGGGTGTFSTSDFLTLFGFSTQGQMMAVLMDEIRISNAGLHEVTPSLTAVPEPSSFALVAVVVAGGAWRKRRQAKRSLERK